MANLWPAGVQPTIDKPSFRPEGLTYTHPEGNRHQTILAERVSDLQDGFVTVL
jgi:hypothetical protein